jgi:hypothetical protein
MAAPAPAPAPASPPPSPSPSPYTLRITTPATQIAFSNLTPEWNEAVARRMRQDATYVAVVDIIITLQYKGDTLMRDMKAAYRDVMFEDWEVRSDVDIQSIVWAHPQYFDVTPGAGDQFVVSRHDTDAWY